MKRMTLFTIALAVAPAALCAQVSGRAQTSGTATARTPNVAANTKVDAAADAHFKAPKGWTAEGAAKLEAIYADAEKKDVPRQPIADRVAEGQAKGASQTTIIASAGELKSRMEASQEAMVKAGRKPSPEETERGAMLMERGVTKSQLEVMAEHTPNDRSLVVAFDVLGRLAAKGVPVTQALARVQGKLDARASDEAIISLVGKSNGNPPAAGGMTMGMATAASGNAAAGASASGAVGATKGVTAGVAGTVSGVVKRP